MQKLNNQATYDNLTGVYSRHAGLDFLKDRIEKCRRNGSFTLVFLDIDYLNTINDEYGHEEGDRYLIRVVDAIRSSLRIYDLIIRLGGMSF